MNDYSHERNNYPNNSTARKSKSHIEIYFSIVINKVATNLPIMFRPDLRHKHRPQQPPALNHCIDGAIAPDPNARASSDRECNHMQSGPIFSCQDGQVSSKKTPSPYRSLSQERGARTTLTVWLWFYVCYCQESNKQKQADQERNVASHRPSPRCCCLSCCCCVPSWLSLNEADMAFFLLHTLRCTVAAGRHEVMMVGQPRRIPLVAVPTTTGAETRKRGHEEQRRQPSDRSGDGQAETRIRAA